MALVNRFDGEFPKRYFKQVLEYMGMTEKRFWGLIDEFRSSHIWKNINGKWKLRHTVNNDGTDD